MKLQSQLFENEINFLVVKFGSRQITFLFYGEVPIDVSSVHLTASLVCLNMFY